MGPFCPSEGRRISMGICTGSVVVFVGAPKYQSGEVVVNEFEGFSGGRIRFRRPMFYYLKGVVVRSQGRDVFRAIQSSLFHQLFNIFSQLLHGIFTGIAFDSLLNWIDCLGKESLVVDRLVL